MIGRSKWVKEVGVKQTKIDVPAHPVISAPFAFSSSLLILLYVVNVRLLSKRELFWYPLLFRQFHVSEL